MQNLEMPRKLWMKYVWIFNDSEDDWDVDDDAEMPDPDDIAAAMNAAAQDLFLRLNLWADQWEGVVDFNDPYLNTSRLALVRVITLGGALIGTVQDQGDTDSPSEVFLLIPQNAGKLPVESELRTALTFLFRFGYGEGALGRDRPPRSSRLNASPDRADPEGRLSERYDRYALLRQEGSYRSNAEARHAIRHAVLKRLDLFTDQSFSARVLSDRQIWAQGRPILGSPGFQTSSSEKCRGFVRPWNVAAW
jgi:hypothetical protein